MTTVARKLLVPLREWMAGPGRNRRGRRGWRGRRVRAGANASPPLPSSRFRAGPRTGRARPSRLRPRLRTSALVSFGLHATLLALLLVGGHRSLLPPAPAQKAQVELLMVEQKGAGNTTVPPSAAPSRPAPIEQSRPEAPPPPSTVGEAQASAPPPVQDQQATEPLPAPPVPPEQPPEAAKPAVVAAPPEPPSPPAPAAPQAQVASAKPEAHPDLTFNLGGTDSETNALASGDSIIPASPDNHHRNRPPVYPQEAALRGDQGTVVLMIHISPLGLPSGVDVLESSGYGSLDQAAMQAVRAWRFIPAVKDGQAVPFDMPMRFIFSFN